jgi:hypothetical protein
VTAKIVDDALFVRTWLKGGVVACMREFKVGRSGAHSFASKLRQRGVRLPHGTKKRVINVDALNAIIEEHLR